MSEYLEAVSRLNAAGERPPGDNRNYYFPYDIHKYDNASWYNRVMDETGMAKVPRYAIEQRLESDKAIMTANNRKYFNLDPSFTFAHGTRKSIGLRSIQARDMYVGTYMTFHIIINYDDREGVTKNMQLEEAILLAEKNNILEITEYFNKTLNAQLQEITDKNHQLYISYSPKKRNMNIEVYAKSTATPFYNVIHNITIESNSTSEKILCAYYNIKPENMEFIEVFNNLRISDVYHNNVKDNVVFRASFVDYTNDNYLGETGQDYSLVNKLYNYREQCPQIWIETYDKNGDPVDFVSEEIDEITVGNVYTVELSLICDTNNNMLKYY